MCVSHLVLSPLCADPCCSSSCAACPWRQKGAMFATVAVIAAAARAAGAVRKRPHSTAPTFTINWPSNRAPMTPSSSATTRNSWYGAAEQQQGWAWSALTPPPAKYTVRHDAARAESAFLRAVKADPSDAEALGRYAMFLWLERGDWGAAEALFRAAVEVDPDNPWRAGSYARFLWDAEVSGIPLRLWGVGGWSIGGQCLVSRYCVHGRLMYLSASGMEKRKKSRTVLTAQHNRPRVTEQGLDGIGSGGSHSCDSFERAKKAGRELSLLASRKAY
eukprot:scaffold1472_cov310-Prasinococcus_capsulatus_cf.AAC.2